MKNSYDTHDGRYADQIRDLILAVNAGNERAMNARLKTLAWDALGYHWNPNLTIPNAEQAIKEST